jgi:hypothetical protein
MSRKRAIVLYVNTETSQDVGKLVGEIVAGVAVQLHDGAEEGILSAGQMFSYLKPAFRFPAAGQGMSVSIGIAHVRASAWAGIRLAARARSGNLRNLIVL